MKKFLQTILLLLVVTMMFVSVCACGDDSGDQSQTETKYTLTIMNGDVVESTTQLKAGDSIEYPTLTKDGYILSWDKSDEMMPEDDLTINAVWTAIDYTVVFDSKGGSAVEDATYTIVSEVVVLPTTVTKVGYTFAGWYDNEDCNGDAVTEIATGSTGNKTFYAKWDVLTYDITYNENEGSAVEDATYTVESETITLPTTSTKQHYVFAGWYDNADFDGEPVTEIATGSTGNKTFYAKWDVQQYLITYDVNGGETISEGDYTIESETIILPKPTKQYSNFMGWYDNADFDGEPVTEIATGSTGDKIFYAKWIEKGFDPVKYATGTNENDKKLFEITGANITVDANLGLHRPWDGYKLPGVNPDLDTQEARTFTFKFINEGEFNYTNGGRISFILTNKNPENDTREVTITAKLADGTDVAVKKQSDGTLANGVHLPNGGSTNIDTLYFDIPAGKSLQDAVLTFKFNYFRVNCGIRDIRIAPIPVEYTINYNVNGGQEIQPGIYKAGVAFTLPKPIKTFNTFMGWYDNADFNGEPVTEITTDSTGDKTFFAKWQGDGSGKIMYATGTNASDKGLFEIVGANMSANPDTGLFRPWNGGGDTFSITFKNDGGFDYTNGARVEFALTCAGSAKTTIEIQVELSDGTKIDIKSLSSNTAVTSLNIEGTNTNGQGLYFDIPAGKSLQGVKLTLKLGNNLANCGFKNFIISPIPVV